MNNNIFVLDSSVIFKPILDEPGKELVKKLIFLKENFKISIFLPEIFKYEFFSIISRIKGPEVALFSYNKFTTRQVSIIPLEEEIIKYAIKINDQYPGTSFYDAVYHALAKAYNTDLITADEQYYRLTKAEGNIKLLKDLKI